MDFDYRKGGVSTSGRQETVNYDNSKSSSMFGLRFDRSGTVAAPQSQPYYTRIAQPVGPLVNRPPPPIPSTSSSDNLPTTGIRVAIKPEYRVGPAVQLILLPNAEVPRSLFNFDFELERRILAEAEREARGWDLAKANDDSNLTPGMAETPLLTSTLPWVFIRKLL